MTFYQVREYARTGLHVRRESWEADQWWSLWRGVWWYQTGDITRPVETEDYATEDLTATDWTTMPAALAACPVNPSIPGDTGGEVAPLPGGTVLGPAAPALSGPPFSTGGGSIPVGGGGGPVMPTIPPWPGPGRERKCRSSTSNVIMQVAGVDPVGGAYGSPNGFHTLVWNVDDLEWQKHLSSADGFVLGCHCSGEGDYYRRIVSDVYGPIGGDTAKLGEWTPMDLGTHWSDGRARIL